MKTKVLAVAIVAIICGNVTPSHASLVFYNSIIGLTANGGPQTLEMFNSLSPQAFVSPGGTTFSTTIGGFTLSGNGNGDFVGIGNDSVAANGLDAGFLQFGDANPLTGNHEGNGGDGPSLTFTFPTPHTVFGFTWVSVDPGNTYSVMVDGVTLGNPLFSVDGTGIGFFGVVGFQGETFTTISLAPSGGTGGSFGIDNVRYSAMPTPEPSSVALLCSGVPLGLVAWKRRRKQS